MNQQNQNQKRAQKFWWFEARCEFHYYLHPYLSTLQLELLLSMLKKLIKIYIVYFFNPLFDQNSSQLEETYLLNKVNRSCYNFFEVLKFFFPWYLLFYVVLYINSREARQKQQENWHQNSKQVISTKKTSRTCFFNSIHWDIRNKTFDVKMAYKKYSDQSKLDNFLNFLQKVLYLKG